MRRKIKWVSAQPVPPVSALHCMALWRIYLDMVGNEKSLSSKINISFAWPTDTHSRVQRLSSVMPAYGALLAQCAIASRTWACHDALPSTSQFWTIATPKPGCAGAMLISTGQWTTGGESSGMIMHFLAGTLWASVGVMAGWSCIPPQVCHPVRVAQSFGANMGMLQWSQLWKLSNIRWDNDFWSVPNHTLTASTPLHVSPLSPAHRCDLPTRWCNLPQPDWFGNGSMPATSNCSHGQLSQLTSPHRKPVECTCA